MKNAGATGNCRNGGVSGSLPKPSPSAATATAHPPSGRPQSDGWRNRLCPHPHYGCAPATAGTLSGNPYRHLMNRTHKGPNRSLPHAPPDAPPWWSDRSVPDPACRTSHQTKVVPSGNRHRPIAAKRTCRHTADVGNGCAAPCPCGTAIRPAKGWRNRNKKDSARPNNSGCNLPAILKNRCRDKNRALLSGCCRHFHTD